MNERDIEYLRNINTSPGPNAGRSLPNTNSSHTPASIDPTKPGPDDVIYAQIRAFRIAFHECTMHHPNPGALPTYAVEKGLLAALAQSDAKPVAWLVHSDRGMNFATVDKPSAYLYAGKHPNYSVEPLYTAPPRPDASAAEDAEPSKRWGYPDEDD